MRSSASCARSPPRRGQRCSRKVRRASASIRVFRGSIKTATVPISPVAAWLTNPASVGTTSFVSSPASRCAATTRASSPRTRKSRSPRTSSSAAIGCACWSRPRATMRLARRFPASAYTRSCCRSWSAARKSSAARTPKKPWVRPPWAGVPRPVRRRSPRVAVRRSPLLRLSPCRLPSASPAWPSASPVWLSARPL